MIENADAQAHVYLKSKESKDEMLVRLIRLKQEFYKPPGAATSARELELASPKNIVFLYIEAMLTHRGMLLENVIAGFDKDGKGQFLLRLDYMRLCSAITLIFISVALEGRYVI